MKKIFAIVAILSLLMVPFVSMAATMSDADLATVTGQSGVTIGISSLTLALSINTITWGDYDGDQTLNTGYDAAGYVNVSLYPVPMHIGIGSIVLTVDVGTASAGVNLGKSAVILGVTIPSPITIDAFVADINVDAVNGAVADYSDQAGHGTSYTHVASAYAAAVGLPADALGRAALGNYHFGAAGTLQADELGIFGISGVAVSIPNSLVITIAPH